MNDSSQNFVAFLLGVNVGRRRMKMADLKAVFEKLGFKNVKTVLASGNVLFHSNFTAPVVKEKIEKKLLEHFRFEVKVILRSVTQIQKMIGSDPFKNISVTQNTRLYVLFLENTHNSTITLPYLSQLKDFEILRIDDQEVYSVLTLTPNAHTVDSMNILGKEFGKHTTMRNWNTILKLVK